MALEGRHETGDIHFVQADEEEENEHTSARTSSRCSEDSIHQTPVSFHDRPENHACRRIGDDGVQPQPAKNASANLATMISIPRVNSDLVQFIRVLGETEQIDYLLEREAFHGHRGVLRRCRLEGIQYGLVSFRPRGTCRPYRSRSGHGVGSLVIVRPVLELHAVDFHGAGISHRVEKALPTQIGAAGFEAGDGQASGQKTFQRNEPGFRPGVRTPRGPCGIEPPRGCSRRRGEELLA